MKAATLPSLRGGAWQRRTRLDRAANALADRHYSRRRPGSGQVGPPGLIVAAMETTASLWSERPRDGWVTWVDTRKVRSTNPGFCFLKAGWWRDRDWSHRYLIRLRADA